MSTTEIIEEEIYDRDRDRDLDLLVLSLVSSAELKWNWKFYTFYLKHIQPHIHDRLGNCSLKCSYSFTCRIDNAYPLRFLGVILLDLLLGEFSLNQNVDE